MVYSFYNFKLKQAAASIHPTPRSLYNNKIKTSGSGQPFNEQLVPLSAFSPTLATDYGWHDKQTTPSAFENYANDQGSGRIIGRSGPTTDRQSQGCVRFDSIDIAQGVTIQQAKLKLYFNTGLGAPDYRLKGLDEDDGDSPADLSGWQTDVASNLTTANVSWTPGIFDLTGYFYSGDIKTIIQEIVDRGSWAYGNAIVIFILDESATQYQYRSVWMHHVDENKVPVLEITT
jgi:hypothetical protein